MSSFHRPRRSPRGRPAHALHLAAQGARGRHRAQSGNAGRRDGAADPHRDAHRRHADLEAPAPAPRSAGDFADHAGAAGAAARLRRRALSVRLAQARDPRRVACAGHLEARRSAFARPGAAVSPRAGSHQRRPLGDRGGAGRARALHGAATQRVRHARADLIIAEGGAAPRRHHARYARAAALGRPFGAPRARRNLPAHQGAPHHARLRQHPQPGRRHFPGALAHQRRQSRHRAASRLARRGAAAQGRRPRWPPAGCAPSSAPPRSISASTGATSISSSMSARRRAPRGCCSASAAPITAWTSRRRACWCRQTASRCWNAAPRSTPSPRMRRTRRRCASARSTCWRSTCSAAPAASRSWATSFMPK